MIKYADVLQKLSDSNGISSNSSSGSSSSSSCRIIVVIVVVGVVIVVAVAVVVVGVACCGEEGQPSLCLLPSWADTYHLVYS